LHAAAPVVCLEKKNLGGKKIARWLAGMYSLLSAFFIYTTLANPAVSE
jgi:hypothetical protein